MMAISHGLFRSAQ